MGGERAHIQTSAEREVARGERVRAGVGRDRAVRAAAALGVLWLALYAAAVALSDSDALSGKIVGDVVYLLPVVACTALAIFAALKAAPGRRRFWRFLAASQLLWLAGEVTWGYYELVLGQEPFPSIADGFYLGGMALMLPTVVLAFAGRPRLRVWRGALDASIMTLTAGYVGWTVLIAPQLSGGASLAAVLSIAYPLFSVAILMVCCTVGLSSHHRLPYSTALVIAGIVSGALANAAYTYFASMNEYVSGSWINLGWQLEAVLYALAGLVALRHDEVEARSRRYSRELGLPVVLTGVAACFTVVAVNSADGTVDLTSLALLGYAFAAVVVRLWLTTREARQIAGQLEDALALQEQLAVTDALTGLHNRRFFEEMLRLEVERSSREEKDVGLLVIDLDYFKRVNDRFGHPAGDSVLRDAAERLANVARSYDVVARYGGEEFTIVVPDADRDALAEMAERFRVAIGERPFLLDDGQTLQVSASVGGATFPTHAASTLELMQAADKALYVAKDHGRNRTHLAGADGCGSIEELFDWSSVMVFLQNLADEIDGRQSTDEHSRAMSAWAGSVADALGLEPAVRWRCVVGARFHDIGKVRVPEAVLTKPGKLNDAEWELIRQHPQHGARILALAPELEDVVPVVLHHHERWDGGGYPDRRAGDSIPIEARIVAVCDAWAAMRADRPYRRALDLATAAGELRACSGSQFDPDVVDAFLALDSIGDLGAAALRADESFVS